ncbi:MULTISPECIES: hypothetical protein [unclassified Streptomyces]|uniref:hypothetical protein n=1 Tax=unclassified Streptomyces TaxID=2593676 RepID=UPI00382524FC
MRRAAGPADLGRAAGCAGPVLGPCPPAKGALPAPRGAADPLPADASPVRQLLHDDSTVTGPVTYEPDRVPYDNSAAAGNGKDDYRTAREEVYRAANTLPDDPARLPATIRSFHPTGRTAGSPPEAGARHSFRATGLVAEACPVAPAGLARIHRAMATIPGVQVTGHLVKDAAGREAIAITRKEDSGHEQPEILLDPHDFGYVGQRFVVTEDCTYGLSNGEAQGPTSGFGAGQILTSDARVEAAVVDAEGEKP